jgi:environmental stress-induced protein Ves
VRVLRSADVQRVRWRNDGGWTRELLRAPAEAADGPDDFDWRVSVADVESDGPFSAFDGYDRLLVLLDGAGMDLHFTVTGQTMRLRGDNRRARFRGESPISATLVDGPTTDFNLIWRRDVFVGAARFVERGDDVGIGGGDGVVAGLFVVSGTASSTGAPALAPGDTIVGEPGERLEAAITGSAVAFLIAPAAGD